MMRMFHYSLPLDLEYNMALSDRRIMQELSEGDIVISPFDARNLTTSSYDVTLGEFFYRPNRLTGQNVYNIYDRNETEAHWGRVQRAVKAKDSKLEIHGTGIDPDDLVIMIAPGETILAHTNEFIGGRNHITTMMKSRSSMGRQMIAVCKCAGWGDVGFINRWTLEITNYSMDHFIPLVVGRRIAQIVFFETGPIFGVDYASQGKYQTSADLEELQKNWKPEDMLPKLYKDRDIKK